MRIVLELREHLVAVELGHEDVEQQQVERLLPQQVERLAAVLGEADGMALSLEAAREHEPVHPVVVGDEDLAVHGSGCFHAGDSERSADRASSSGRYSCSIRSTSSEA